MGLGSAAATARCHTDSSHAAPHSGALRGSGAGSRSSTSTSGSGCTNSGLGTLTAQSEAARHHAAAKLAAREATCVCTGARAPLQSECGAACWTLSCHCCLAHDAMAWPVRRSIAAQSCSVASVEAFATKCNRLIPADARQEAHARQRAAEQQQQGHLPQRTAQPDQRLQPPVPAQARPQPVPASTHVRSSYQATILANGQLHQFDYSSSIAGNISHVDDCLAALCVGHTCSFRGLRE